MPDRESIARRRRAMGLFDGDELTPKGEQVAEERHYPSKWEMVEPDDGMDPEPYEGGSLV
jgi:hypothetical protein